MKNVIRMAACLMVATVVGPAPGALAEERPCMADAARLCPGVKAGGGAQMECLKAHKQELSPACKQNVLSAEMKHKEQQQLQEQQQQAPQPH